MAIKLTITGDVTITREISLQKAGQIITFLGLDETDKEPTNTSFNPNLFVADSTASVSPQELIMDANAKTYAQKITVLVKYFTERDKQEGVLSKEILLQLRKMGEEPGNFKRDLQTAVSLQYLYVLDSKQGLYAISQKGRAAIDSKFSNEASVKVKSKSRGVFQKAIPPRSEVTTLTWVASLEGFPDFHSLTTKADSILWILAYAEFQGIESLTPREVELASDHLKKKIPHKDFSAHNKRNIKSSLVASTGGKFKLQQKGINHLKSFLINKSNAEDEGKGNT